MKDSLEYYGHHTIGGCFGTSLANTLIMYAKCANGHGPFYANLAKTVRASFKEHPFVTSKGGVHRSLSTRIVSELTSGRFEARYHRRGTYTPQELRESFETFYPTDKVDYFMQVEAEERAAGRILGMNGTIPVVLLPCIGTNVVASKEGHAFVVRSIDHTPEVLVATIQDGDQMLWRNLEENLTGLIELRPSL